MSVVITGVGLITALGLDRQATWQAVLDGRCGIGPLTAIESSLHPDKGGGQAPDLPPDPQDSPDAPREVRYLGRAVRQALLDAGVDQTLPYPAHRCAIMLGTTLHGMRAAGQYLRSNDANPLRNFLAGATLRHSVGDILDAAGFAATTCSACSSSLGSVALAVTLLHSGRFDLVLTGGYDTISEYAYAGFNSLRLVADGPQRPFAHDRQGMKLAEGYGMLVLERSADAARRGAKPLAQVLGFGESADAHHLTQPHPQGEGAALAISAALHHAGLGPDDIDLICAHATATPDNDAGEYAALAAVFADRLPRVPVVAFKSHLGHTLGGAGAVELILAALALNGRTIPACANVKQEDVHFPNLRLSTGEPLDRPLRAALNLSLGFGGANTCIVLAPPDSPSPGAPPLQSGLAASAASVDSVDRALIPTLSRSTGRGGNQGRDVLITGIGVLLPGAVGNEPFLALLSRDSPIESDTGSIEESDIAHLLNSRRVRRMSQYVKLSLAATAIACHHAKLDDPAALEKSCCAILGTMHGSAGYSSAYYRQIIEEGINAANPMFFAEGVPNAAAAHLSLMLSLRGGCQTIIGSRHAALDAMWLASMRIAQGDCEMALVGAAEEYDPLIITAYTQCGLHTDRYTPPRSSPAGFVSGAGAVTFVLESADSARRRGVEAIGFVRDGASVAAGPERSVESASRLWEELGRPRVVLSCANATWIDRLEAAALRRSESTVVSTLYGRIAECFSVMPLASIAAALLGGRRPDPFAVLCADYTGSLSGLRIESARP